MKSRTCGWIRLRQRDPLNPVVPDRLDKEMLAPLQWQSGDEAVRGLGLSDAGDGLPSPPLSMHSPPGNAPTTSPPPAMSPLIKIRSSGGRAI